MTSRDCGWRLPKGAARRACLWLVTLGVGASLPGQPFDPLEERRNGIEDLFREAVERKRRELGPMDPATASAQRDLGLLLLDRGRAADAEGHLREALRAHEGMERPDALEVARDAFGLAQAVLRLADNAGSERLSAKAFQLLEASGSPDPDLEAEARLLHAGLARSRGDLPQAAERYAALVELRPDPDSMLEFAEVLERLGRPAEAERILSKAFEMRTVPGMPPHAQTGEILHRLALLAAGDSDYSRARSLLQRAGDAFAESSGVETEAAAAAADSLGNVLRAMGDVEAAIAVLASTLALRTRLLGARHPDVALTANNLAGAYHVADRLDQAEPLYRRAIGILEESHGESDIRVADSLFNLGYLLYAKGERVEAAGMFRRTLSILEAAGEGRSPMAADTRSAIDMAAGR